MNGKDLKKWRKTKHLTQEDAAGKLRVKLDTFRKWEQGINPIPELLELAMKGLD